MKDAATEYAEAVATGAVVAGRLVRLACRRHLDDLAGGAARGLRYDATLADRACRFFPKVLRLAGGEHEGKPFELQPWQAFIVGSLFGWIGPDGYRRFRLAYIEIGKGNGKSPLCAGIGLYCLVADREPRAEVYAAATKKDQAMVLFRDAVAMVDQSPSLRAALEKSGAKGREWNLAHHASGSWFRAIASDDGQSGPRPHCALIDEIHEHRTPLVVDMMRAGTKGRRQALIVEITNSGHDRETVCWRHHQYSDDVLSGKKQNDSWFAYVCGLDACASHAEEGKTQPAEGCPDCDDWRDERVWPKVNPNLGVSVTAKYLREQVREAEGVAGKAGVVRRLNFCLWTEGASPWLSPSLWARGAGPIDRQSLRGARCWGALDISARLDVTAFVLCFPCDLEDGRREYRFLAWLWIPEMTADAHDLAGEATYRAWAEAGWVTLQPGETIDQRPIEECVLQARQEYQLEDVFVDPWNAAQLGVLLQEQGVKVVEFRQNALSYNEPTREFEAAVKRGEIRHGDNPALAWMAGNAQVLQTRDQKLMPAKPHHSSPKKIDGLACMVMSFAGARKAPNSSGGGFEFF